MVLLANGSTAFHRFDCVAHPRSRRVAVRRVCLSATSGWRPLPAFSWQPPIFVASFVSFALRQRWLCSHCLAALGIQFCLVAMECNAALCQVFALMFQHLQHPDFRSCPTNVGRAFLRSCSVAPDSLLEAPRRIEHWGPPICDHWELELLHVCS